jgi:hypothetical protein
LQPYKTLPRLLTNWQEISYASFYQEEAGLQISPEVCEPVFFCWSKHAKTGACLSRWDTILQYRSTAISQYRYGESPIGFTQAAVALGCGQ